MSIKYLLIYMLALIFITSTSTSYSSNRDDQINGPNGTKILNGQYINYNYGYSVVIPKGLVAITAPPPAPQHGFSIELSKKPESYIWVDGSYGEKEEIVSLEVAVDKHLDWFKTEGIDIVVLKRSLIRLHNLQAMQLVIGYKDIKSNKSMLHEKIIAISKKKRKIGIVYTIGLITSESNYNENKKLFDKLVKTWRVRL